MSEDNIKNVLWTHNLIKEIKKQKYVQHMEIYLGVAK